MLLNLLSLSAMAQNAPIGKIKDPGEQFPQKCDRYIVVREDIPIEENYYIRNYDGTLYLVITDEEYYKRMFKKRNDGFAVDVIRQEQYACGQPNDLDDSWAHKGTLLPPLFKKKFKKKIIRRDGNVLIPYQKLPAQFNPARVEYNLVILQKKWYCDYRQYTSIKDDTWSLLPMGLYRDSLPPNVGARYQNLTKLVSYTVPFDQNEVIVSPALIKPLYDTLNLTDYVIREIRINAYASVEGSLARNIELQEARAQSIVDALQAYQNEKVKSTVTARENWDDFNKEVSKTPFSHLAYLPKNEVKQQLATDKALMKRLQPILSKHRKADIDIRLEKRLTTETNDPAILRQFFDQKIKEKNIEEALFIQQEIFRKIKDQHLPEDFIGELEIPKTADHSPLLNNELIFKNEQGFSSEAETLNHLLQLDALIPNRPKIAFNIVALKLKLWISTRNVRNTNGINDKLKLLVASDLPQFVVARLRMNYNILRVNYYNQIKNYKRKNALLSRIHDEYQQTHLTDEERLSLAMYMAYYKQYGLARSILRPRARHETASTDILFYYLSLIFNNSEDLSDGELGRIMQRTIERDTPRFCDLLAPMPLGGVSFQLLEDPEIKALFCQSCTGN